MKNLKQTVIAFTAAVAACATFIAVAPAATAADQNSSVVSSERSFPKTTTARKDLLKESTSTDVESDSNWGGIESLNVPQTKSQAEKDAEAKAKAQQEAAAAAAQAQSQAASRSATRESFDTSNLPAATGNAAGIVALGLAIAADDRYQYGGCNPPYNMDCSCFVQYVFAQNGISLPRTSGAQATVGVAVPSLAEAQPGDIIANANHAAIYIGNGMLVDAENYGYGIRTNPVSWSFGGQSYSIRRVG
ncbi:C40 family peptidase [Bifidobacterium stellenboschense]|uniref:NlpC/P60 family protein n=1 Tax=Bifidobacterium stellenboschense TaxID=762211 RepID=A0A087E0M1_9BIFI|nr:C40 family peptidase [Bifidobacterium stellenboschense]KFJ01322.1 NlpC/P60 family protein [Bifidobacterium stellenboschense]